MNMSPTSSQVLHKVKFSSTKNSQLPKEVENGNTDVFKKPVGLPPRRGRQRKQEKAKIVENNCSIELRRSNRRVTPNKCFQFVQQLYQQVEERRIRTQSSVIRSSLRSMTPSFQLRLMPGITPNTTQKSTILPPFEEEEKNELITPGNERNNKLTLKRFFRKVAIKTKKNKDSTNEKHESKGNWKVRSCKQTTNSNINEAMHISKCSKNMETPAAPVLPVNSNMKSQNKSRNLKRARKNDFTRNSEEIDESPETHISKKTYASKLSKKAETLSSSSSPLAPLPLQSPYTNKQCNMHIKKELKKGHRKEKTMKQAKTSLAKKSTMDKEIPELNDNEEIATPIISKQVKDNFKISQKKTNLKSTAITESSESVIHATPNKILKSSNNTDQVISSTRKELNEQLTKEENVTKQKRRPPKLHFEKPSQKIKITRATAINENVDIDIKEQQWQIQQTNQLHELSMPENDDLNYSHIALPDPTPVHHLNNMFDSFCGTPSLPKALTTTTSNCLNSTSIIPTRCRNVKVRIKKLPNLPENFTPNILATANSGNDNCPLQHQAQQVMSSSQQNSELITWLKKLQDIEIFRSSREVFEEMRISSHTNLYFTTFQGIEYAFYNTDDAATLGYLRFKARQIKTRRRAKFYYLHFITITGTFCFTTNNRKEILTSGDMVAIPKMVHYEIENLTDDIGILMVIKK